jgi:hypothetical protein
MQPDLSTYDRLDCAVSGYLAQYGDRSIGEQHPDLPSGCIGRVESLVDASIAAAGDGRRLLAAVKWVLALHDAGSHSGLDAALRSLRILVDGDR